MDLHLRSLLCHHSLYSFIPQLQNLVLLGLDHDHLHCLVPHCCIPPPWPGTIHISHSTKYPKHMILKLVNDFIYLFIYLLMGRWKEWNTQVHPSWCYTSQGLQTFSTHSGDMLWLCKTLPLTYQMVHVFIIGLINQKRAAPLSPFENDCTVSLFFVFSFSWFDLGHPIWWPIFV